MKKNFLKTKLGIILKSVGIGAIKGVGSPVTGMVLGAVEEVTSNINSSTAGEGAVDWSRMIGFVGGVAVFITLLVMMVKGWITMDELKQLWKLFD